LTGVININPLTLFMSATNNKPATWFWIIGILALLWNFGGIASFIMHVTMSEETLQAMPEEERMLYTNFPVWVMITYSVAVFAGTLGNILLLLRKRSATPLLMVSFVAILFQMIYTVFMSNAVAVHGPQALGIPTFVVVFGALLVWLSLTATVRGWLD
jgi:hypothetical protein